MTRRKKESADKRPDPKPRKRPLLWQSYLFWYELVQMRKRHNLRISAIEAGKSNYDKDFEYRVLEMMDLDNRIENAKKEMIGYGADVGDIWKWVTSIKGLKEGSLAAQVLAQIDDISKFATISKLWRFAGLSVQDGAAERNKKGEKSHANRLLKSICWLISQQFIYQNTPLYRNLYDEEKDRLRNLYPEPIPATSGLWEYKFTDSHVDRMARRKTAKIFLSHLWTQWREFEGLPVSKPYAIDILKHADYIEPEK